MHEDILGIIPARYASTRFPGKPLAMIGNVTMIERVCQQTEKVLKNFCVATDDKRIYDVVQRAGYQAVMTSADHPSGTDRCAEALNTYCKNSGKTFVAVINIQGDEPFIAPEQIATLAETFDDPETQIATLIHRSTTIEDVVNPNKVKVVISTDNRALYFSRSPIPYLRGVEQSDWLTRQEYFTHIGLYGYRVDVLGAITKLQRTPLEKAESLEQLRWLENGYSIRVRLTDSISFGIDTPEDLEELRRRGMF